MTSPRGRRSLFERFMTPVWIVFYYLFLLFFGGGALLFNLAVALRGALPDTPSRQRSMRHSIHRLMRFYTRMLVISGALRIRWHGLERLNDVEGGCVIVANHPSILDAPLVLAQLENAACVFKASLKSHLLNPHAARAAGYIANDEGVDGIRRGVEQLQAGAHLVVFAEGTRTEQPPLNPLNPGFVFFAQRAQRPVQTLLIRNSSNVLSKRCPFYKPPELPVHVDLEFGRSFTLQRGERIETFASRIEAYLKSELSQDT